ncbi:hypothetical protein GW17_00061712 [Ensete ventricosum]|nr:hypothetical protein GW17_00061712 [Ensete ventricosum]
MPAVALSVRTSSSVGHIADDPGRALGRSCISGNHIKRRLHVGLPQATDYNGIKRQPRAEKRPHKRRWQ